MFDASVIICTHNPRRDYLDRAIASLRRQTLPVDKWELIVIDNASKISVADQYDLSWHANAQHVVENKLGLSSARHRGIQESSSQLLIFVDDDNVLATNYLEQALKIERNCQFLGAWGSGSIALEFEVEPPHHVKYLLPWLGLRHSNHPIWSNAISCSDATPIGAGLCIRRAVAEAYIEYCTTSTIQISGRKGSSLAAHEDYEICYLACRNGLGMGVFPELEIVHLISKERVTDQHMLKLVESVTLSGLLLSYKWTGSIPKSSYSARGAIRILVNILNRHGFDRRVYFAELRANIAARRLLA
jgi:glycosyltransferase involved in cell wall biosynthesis